MVRVVLDVAPTDRVYDTAPLEHRCVASKSGDTNRSTRGQCLHEFAPVFEPPKRHNNCDRIHYMLGCKRAVQNVDEVRGATSTFAQHGDNYIRHLRKHQPETHAAGSEMLHEGIDHEIRAIIKPISRNVHERLGIAGDWHLQPVLQFGLGKCMQWMLGARPPQLATHTIQQLGRGHMRPRHHHDRSAGPFKA